MVSNIALWNRIACFTPDDPYASFRFTDRLARENGWSKDFAAEAVGEYKKFVYLATVSATPVTPSDVVDQVWHLHLTFTRSYWDEMCGTVLERPLHHGPTKGGRAEDARYLSQYDATLALYAQEFGIDAPAAFWPDARARFSSARHQSWVDRRTHWVLRKPDWRRWALGAGLAAVSVTAAQAASEAGDDFDTRFTVFAGIGAVVVVALAWMASTAGAKKHKRQDNDSGTSGSFGCGSGSGKHDGGEGGEGGGEGGGDGGGGDGGGCGGGCGGD